MCAHLSVTEKTRKEKTIMGLFDRFKKKDDALDKQIAELQAQNAASAADGDTLKAAQNAENMMKAFSANVSSGAPLAAMAAAKTFGALAGSLAVDTMKAAAARQGGFDIPDVMEVEAGTGYSDKNNFTYGVDNNYAPVYYCEETEKAYAPGWAGLINMIVDADMFNTNGGDSDGVPPVMSIQAGTAANGVYTLVYGVAENYSPVVYCNELKKFVNLTWDDISRYALDEGIDS
jgi:hypothetical protein